MIRASMPTASSVSRTHTLVALLSALVATGLVALLTASPAHAATCSLKGKERRLGPTYTTSLRVTRTSCASGERIVRAFYRCRVRAGGRKGTCRSRVSGYRCSERRSNVIPTQFDARVTCKKGRASVVHSYTQFT